MSHINQQLIKSTNMKMLFSLIQNQKAVSRIALAKATHLSKPTVSALVDELIEKGYVVDCGMGTSTTTGRKPNHLIVNDETNYVAVFHWHKAWLTAALITLSGNVIFEMRVSMEQRSNYVQNTVTIMREDLETYNGNARILGICIIIPGIIDESTQQIVSTVLNIGLENDLLKQLQSQLSSYPINVLNDTPCYAYADGINSSKDDSYYAFINIGSGVGAVIIDHNRVFRAANGMTTQFGHFSVDRNGALCTCGNHGCLERLIGEIYLLDRAGHEGVKELFSNENDATFEVLGKRAAANDPQAIHLLDALAEDLAFALSNLIGLFNPQEVVVGGNGMALGSLFLERVDAHLSQMGFPLFRKRIRLRFSSLNKTSAMRGAARYYIDQYFSFDGEMPNILFIG